VATLRSPVSAVAECRRLAELLRLDAVGLVRTVGGRRRVAWWASPGTEVVSLDRILEGAAPGWIACPRGEDLVFAHLTKGSSVRSVATLSAMLASPSGVDVDSVDADGGDGGLGGVAPQDPIQRERTRLAYTIHDGLTQVVTASVLELEWQARRADVAPEEAVEALSEAAAELRKALDEIRMLLASLSAPVEPSHQPLDDLIRGVTERWRLPATWSFEGDLSAIPPPVLEVASSVIRESVANAAKHSASQEVAVRVQATHAGVEVRVEDRGRGFGTNGNGLHAGHLGLEMMRRRVAEIHGTLDVQSSPGNGTRVVARLPVTDQGVKS
jgi:signal transduction histidine kinase